jgi:RNA polymerase sigma-70 factor (ECF subfamily)
MVADPLQLERDEVRFERLYREYAGDVYRYALAIMRNPSDAEDVTQTTFLNAWRAYSAGEEPRAPLNWFITIAHNVCRLRFRTNSRRPKEVEFEPALAEAPIDDGPTADDVLDALAELPLNQRAALVMRELEGRSYGEIATVLGVSRSAVETLIFRARRSLRIRRDAIRALGALPLPQSLASFLRRRWSR